LVTAAGEGKFNQPAEAVCGPPRRQGLHSIPVLLAQVLANLAESATIRLDRRVVTPKDRPYATTCPWVCRETVPRERERTLSPVLLRSTSQEKTALGGETGRPGLLLKLSEERPDVQAYF
jgi:hypothetical protein